MGFLDKFEKGLERVVTGAFTKTFKSELQPVEIASAIRSEMDSKASILSRERILAPNTFTVHLGKADFERMASLGEPLISELTDLATRHALKQGFQFGAALAIRLVEDSSLTLGQITVESASHKLEVEWTPALDVAGKRYLLNKSRTTVGRDESSDIAIDDSGMSRKHFELLWDGKNAGIRDLGSTNGTRVNGQAVAEGPIAADTIIQAGRSEFVFRIIARSVGN
ncbi:MAG: FhaA domain-containing protein [Micrococcales bacterium]